MLFWIIVITVGLVFIGMIFGSGEFKDDSEPFCKDNELFYLDDMDDPDGPGQCM